MLRKIKIKKRGFCTLERIITFTMLMIFLNLCINIIIICSKNTQNITTKLNDATVIINAVQYIQRECDDSEKIYYYENGTIKDKNVTDILLLKKRYQYRCFYILDNQLYTTLLYEDFHSGNNEAEPPNPMAYNKNNNSTGGFRILKKSDRIYMFIKIGYKKYNYFLCIENFRGLVK